MQISEVRWIEFDQTSDARGTLTVLERPALPFAAARIFCMRQVPDGRERGGHAHRHTRQCAIAVAGSVTFDVSDGERHATFLLNDPTRALYLPAMTWVRLYDFSHDAVALVLCDTVYDPTHVVRSWDEYRQLQREVEVARA